ncbi:MAG: helix-turn-helix domain-containing protein [Bacteroidota bacterium]
MQLQSMAELAATYINTTDRHIFLTGKAGTGKTTFLKYIINHTYKHTIVAAPTGIAAINAGGVTLHSLLQLPFGSFIPDNIPLSASDSRITTPQTLFQNSKFNITKRQLIKEIELLIIDEVSMLRADLLDCIDHTLRHLRRNSIPFGGVQILFIGDLMQLPPVVKDDEKDLLTAFYPSLYFFEAKVLKEVPPIHVELQKIFRQQDKDFIDLLNRLRHNKQTSGDIQFLNRYYNPDFNQSNEKGYIQLTTHNYRADKLNQQKLGALEAKPRTFHALVEGSFPESMYPTSPELCLKEGAQVMFIKNDPSGEGQFFNGKIGLISSLSEDEIWVKFEDGSEVLVTQYQWENKRYTLNKETNEIEETFLGSFEQYPIRLAWAVTVHKSQGLTFEKAILDLSGTFAPGQLYVALSRLTSLKGLVLSSHLPKDPPQINESLSKFNASTAEEKELKENLKKDQTSFLLNMGKTVFDFSSLIRELTYHERSFTKDESRSIKQKYSEWAKGIVRETLPLQKIGDRFTKELHSILGTNEYINHLNERIEKAKTYFLTILSPIADKIQSHLQTVTKEKKVKAYLKELGNLEDAFIKKIRDIERMSFLVMTLKTGGAPALSFKYSTSQLLTQKSRSASKSQKDKTPTATITYELYKQGKTVEEIANDRTLTVGTIEGHLAHYVENGTIPIEDLVDAKKVEKIKEVLESEAVGLGEIKSKLPKNYSYGEIKLVMAHQKMSS